MPQSAFPHGSLPVQVAPNLRCPTASVPSPQHRGHVGAGQQHPGWPSYTVEHVPGVGYRAKFRCSACGFEFTASDAQLRRLVA